MKFDIGTGATGILVSSRQNLTDERQYPDPQPKDGLLFQLLQGIGTVTFPNTKL